ncbi:MAG: lamin tail domain-containing protein [Methanosarcinales archaeon]|nr:lamin tail domain-containing protein [Methanosarcinales archaeon]
MRRSMLIVLSLMAGILAASSTALCGVVINEIALNPSANDPLAAEWVEIYNPGPDNVDIGGWVVVVQAYPWSGSMEMAPGTVIPANGYKVVTGDPRWTHEINASAILYSASGEEIDRTPILEDDEDEGSNWSRYPNGVDNDRLTDWAYITATKGRENVLR